MPSITTRVSVLSVCLLLLCGCATLPPGSKPDSRDPWERMNRATYKFNDKFDKAIARPVARGYRKALPQLVRTGIRNFFDNVDTTIVMINDLLQGQLKAFVNDTARLVINTTFGIGGLFDPATATGLDKNERDFGQTLGKWGLRKGPYVVLPFLGPSDVRDTFGRAADTFSTPRSYIKNKYWLYGTWLLEKVDSRSRLLDYDRLLDSAYDPYAFMRNAYLQHRDFKVNGGQSESEQELEQRLMEEAGEDDTAPPLTPARPTTPQPSPPESPPPPPPPPPPR
jgi:phospholipid-binding lipoprotein MlaA